MLFFFIPKTVSLQKENGSIFTADEGSFAPNFSDDMKALDVLMEVIEALSPDYNYKLALDVAASQFFNEATHRYDSHGTM